MRKMKTRAHSGLPSSRKNPQQSTCFNPHPDDRATPAETANLFYAHSDSLAGFHYRADARKWFCEPIDHWTNRRQRRNMTSVVQHFMFIVGENHKCHPCTRSESQLKSLLKHQFHSIGSHTPSTSSWSTHLFMNRLGRSCSKSETWLSLIGARKRGLVGPRRRSRKSKNKS